MSNKISFPTTVSSAEAAAAVVRDRFIKHRLQSGHNVVFRVDENNDVTIDGDVAKISADDFFGSPFTFVHRVKAEKGIDLGLDEYILERP